MMVSCISRTLNIVAVAENQLSFYTPSDIGFVFIKKITSTKIKSYIFIICALLVCKWKERVIQHCIVLNLVPLERFPSVLQARMVKEQARITRIVYRFPSIKDNNYTTLCQQHIPVV